VEEQRKLYAFSEDPAFTAKLADLAGEDALSVLLEIQADLLADPLRWPVVRGTNGARKGRAALPQNVRGKSGGMRYLYLFLEHRERIYLFYVFSKADQADLTMQQRKAIAKLVDRVKQLP
jgi:hypothetical protein